MVVLFDKQYEWFYFFKGNSQLEPSDGFSKYHSENILHLSSKIIFQIPKTKLPMNYFYRLTK